MPPFPGTRAAMLEPNYERDLLARAADASYPSDLDDLMPAALQRIAAAEGIDFATALIFDRIVNSPRHGPFIRALESSMPACSSPQLAPTLVIVPGGFYKEIRGSG